MSGQTSEHSGFDAPKSAMPAWVPAVMIAGMVISSLALGLAWSAVTHARGVENALGTQDRALQQSADASDSLTQRLARMEVANAQLQDELDAVAKRLKMTQNELSSSRRQNDQVRDEYTKNLDAVQAQLAGKANANDVTALSSSLGGDIQGVKAGLDATNTSLSNTRDEFGTLIAKNHDEIQQLRAQGERDYFEFTLAGKGQRSKVGGLMIELRGTNTKKNQFTMVLYVDDMRLEKKNRSVDEPIYFYTRGTHTPLELVVNEVGKNRVEGYLSEPKHDVNSASASVQN